MSTKTLSRNLAGKNQKIRMINGTVYLIHLDSKLAHSQHYIGFTELDDVDQRLKVHESGQGSPMLRAANQKGISYHVSRIWHDKTRGFERRLKNAKKSRLLCPVCNPGNAYNHFKSANA